MKLPKKMFKAQDATLNAGLSVDPVLTGLILLESFWNTGPLGHLAPQVQSNLSQPQVAFSAVWA